MRPATAVGAAADTATASGGGDGASAQSLKCNQCETLLKDVAAAELHASKVLVFILLDLSIFLCASLVIWFV